MKSCYRRAAFLFLCVFVITCIIITKQFFLHRCVNWNIKSSLLLIDCKGEWGWLFMRVSPRHRNPFSPNSIIFTLCKWCYSFIKCWDLSGPFQLFDLFFSCYSRLGYVKEAGQLLSIGFGCEQVSVSYQHGTSYWWSAFVCSILIVSWQLTCGHPVSAQICVSYQNITPSIQNFTSWIEFFWIR